MKRTDLVERLELLKPALAETPVIPMYMNYCFDEENIFAYNDALGISTKLPEKLELKQGFGIQGSTLLGLLKNSKAPEVIFDMSSDEVLLKVGRSKMKLPYMPSDEFIFTDATPKDDWPIVLKLNASILEGIKSCMLTTSRDNSLPALMGITIKVTNKINLYSCDGDAISRYFLGKAKGEECKFTIPNDFCDSLLNITNKTKTITGTLFINEEWAIAKLSNDYTIYGRIIETNDEFDHPSLIKKTLQVEPVFMPTPKGMIEALARARVVATSSTAPTLASVNKGKLVLVTDSHVGVVRDVFKLKSNCPDVEASLSAEAVQRSLNVCSEISIMHNCTAYKEGSKFFIVLGNLG